MRETMPLAGEWRFALDPEGVGIEQAWFGSALADRVTLPGTTDTNGKGFPNEERETGQWSRVRRYRGAAWYQRDVEIPAGWGCKHLSLTLERTKNVRVWVDRAEAGADRSLSTPQTHDLSSRLTPGWHTLTIRVSQEGFPAGTGGHQTAAMQTDWNGIVGRIALTAADPIRLARVQVMPDMPGQRARVHVLLKNQAGYLVTGTLTVSAQSWNAPTEHQAPSVTVPFTVMEGEAEFDAELPMGEGMLLWDEFSPALYRLAVRLDAATGGKVYHDERELDFGMREFRAEGTQFAVNGKRVFLRGKHDACSFPLTGYASMEVRDWLRLFRTAKEYGINHYRFHSWCPPEAAFAAADQVGIYLQPELPSDSGFPFGQDAEHDAAMREEGERILRAYGHHPSFVMFALGNEIGGGREAMAALVAHLRALDPTRLYAQGSNNFFREPRLAEGDDYWTTMRTPGQHAVRASFATCDLPLGHVQAASPSTTVDYREAIAGIPVPVIGHEVGQYSSYPDFRERAKYTGILRLRNYEVFREHLAAQGMLDQAQDFFRASGKLAALCYREEVEAALRTPGFGGFQLLDLVDNQEQGTSLVGILDAFMDSKGILSPEAWREFCAPTVLLARMPRCTWTTEDVLAARVEIAHYGPAALPGTVPTWALRDAEGRELAAGELPAVDVPQGGLFPLGEIRAPLDAYPAPARLTLEIGVRGTALANRYPLWLYPVAAQVVPPGGVLLRQTPDAETRQLLDAGKAVVLLPDPGRLARSIEGAFATDFWNWPMFRSICRSVKHPATAADLGIDCPVCARDRPLSFEHAPVAPGTMGILTDPAHPALARFPTEFHSDWQWWHLVMSARSVILDETPAGYRPIVQTIDNFARNHKLGLIFEAKVGAGRLLVCTINLAAHQDRPEARQLLHSLLAYAGSAAFAPETDLPWDLLERIMAEGEPTIW